jgi:tetratricopeptide (TPR) repeat protein
MWKIIFIVTSILLLIIGLYLAIKEYKEKKKIKVTGGLLIVLAFALLTYGKPILELIVPSETEKKLTRIEQKLGRVTDYLDGLPQTKNPDLKKLFEKGYSLYKDEKYPEAIDTFKACIELKTRDSERQALLVLIGNAYFTLGKLKEAEDSYEEALLIAKRIDDEEGEATALGNIGLIYQAKGSLDQALKYQKEALEIHREIGLRENGFGQHRSHLSRSR